MSFARIARVLEKTVYRACTQGTKGLAAGAAGGAVLIAADDIDENIVNCLIMGVLIGGINGAVDGFLEQLAIEMGPEITLPISINNQPVTGNIPDPTLVRLHQVTELASFATPALAWFIQSQADVTNLNIGLTFATYWTGIGLLTGGAFAALMTLGCCCALPSAILLGAMMKAFVSSNYGDFLAAQVEGLHDRFFNHDNGNGGAANVRAIPTSNMAAPAFATNSHVITVGGLGNHSMFGNSSIDNLFAQQQQRMDAMIGGAMNGGSRFGNNGFNF